MPVTIRVAWELVVNRVRVRPEVLADAREHVLHCLPPGTGSEEADVLAAVYTRDYLDRVRDGRYRRATLDPDLGIAISRDWRKHISSALDRVGEVVFRLHYGDAMALEAVEGVAGIDRAVLAAARAGIRDALRLLSTSDDLALGSWPDARLDRLLARMANLPSEGCPGPVGLLSGSGLDHADRCPRCSRAVRLLKGGVLSPNDLFAPKGQGLVAEGDLDLLAVMLHPDGLRHRRHVERVLGDEALAVGDDCWVLPWEQAGRLGAALAPLCTEGTPPRHHLRGARARGQGRVSRGTYLGPVPVEALDAARTRHWAEVDGVGELPASLPPPPKATAWWAAASLAGATAVLTGIWVLTPRPPPPETPLEARFALRDDAWAVRFDAQDLAVVDVVVQRGGELLHYGGPVVAAKGAWATGEGDYAFAVRGKRVGVVASPEGIDQLEQLIAEARTQPAPLDFLAGRIRERDPRADVAISPRRRDGDEAL